jgi:hypothetical protein
MHSYLCRCDVRLFPFRCVLRHSFLQDLEQNRLKHLLEYKMIACYNRHLDDIFIIYNETKITPQNNT